MEIAVGIERRVVAAGVARHHVVDLEAVQGEGAGEVREVGGGRGRRGGGHDPAARDDGAQQQAEHDSGDRGHRAEGYHRPRGAAGTPASGLSGRGPVASRP